MPTPRRHRAREHDDSSPASSGRLLDRLSGRYSPSHTTAVTLAADRTLVNRPTARNVLAAPIEPARAWRKLCFVDLSAREGSLLACQDRPSRPSASRQRQQLAALDLDQRERAVLDVEEACNVLDYLPNPAKPLTKADLELRNRVYDAFGLAVELDHNTLGGAPVERLQYRKQSR
jgi:hypothetical protein